MGTRICIFVPFAFMIFILASPLFADETRTVDTSVFPVTEQTFGLDSFQYRAARWSIGEPLFEPDDNLWHVDNVPWTVMGLNRIGWDMIEPAAPEEGVHTYDWSTLDLYFEYIYDCGKVAQIQFYPRSSWGCEKWHPGWDDDKALQSPPIHDPPTEDYMDDWQEAVEALVERYDGDGTNDAEFMDGEPGHKVPRQLIVRIDIGAEVEFPKWKVDINKPGGDEIDKYFTTLVYAYNGVSDAETTGSTLEYDIKVGRAGWAYLDLFNDNPDLSEINTRIGTGQDSWYPNFRFDDWLDKSLNYTDYYDVFNVHVSGKYNSTLGLYNYLRDEMGLSEDIQIVIEDLNISPHNGHWPEHWDVCPYALADDDNNEWQDVIETLKARMDYGWDDAEFEAAAEEYFPLLAANLTKRMVFGLMTGIECQYVQPCVDGLTLLNKKNQHWICAGLASDIAYDYFEDAEDSRKQPYFQFVWLYDKLLGVKDGEILKEDESTGTCFPLACVYELTQSNDAPLWVMWHDSIVGNNDTVTYQLYSDADYFRVYYTIEDWGQTDPEVDYFPINNGSRTFTLTNSPIFVEEYNGIPPGSGIPN